MSPVEARELDTQICTNLSSIPTSSAVHFTKAGQPEIFTSIPSLSSLSRPGVACIYGRKDGKGGVSLTVIFTSTSDESLKLSVTKYVKLSSPRKPSFGV